MNTPFSATAAVRSNERTGESRMMLSLRRIDLLYERGDVIGNVGPARV
jgi:hypothetical protein